MVLSVVLFAISADDFKLNINQAIPCGLIINELVTNGYKHAYPKEESGTVEVTIAERDEQVFIEVSDEGVGLPKDFSMDTTDSLGFKLVQILSNQMDAEVTISSEEGTTITVLFTKEDKKGASSTMV